MKKSLLYLIAATLVWGAFTTPLFAQESDQLDVDVATICTGVANLEPIGPDVSFPVSVGELYCFTRVVGANTPTKITHVWSFGPTERASVELAIGGPRWRTYSSKKIQAHEIGSWRVEVLDVEGTVLKVIQFITTAEAGAAAPEPTPPVEPGQEEPEQPPVEEAPIEQPVE